MAEEEKKNKYIERRINLTKEFHDEYWDNRDTTLKQTMYCMIGVAAILVIVMILGYVYPDSITLIGGLAFMLGGLCMVTGLFAYGIHEGIGIVGRQINRKIEDEYPDYHKDDKE